ncbi:hypothetical protein PtB15_6B51 [Puccinia triticina]|nr:hypothetical protein PtB15_6B51 [Puccinia triticina]
MEDPVKELPEVVRKITEPYAATEIAHNVKKQEDNYPNDLHRAGLDLIPGLASVLAIWKLAIALTSALVGNFYLKHGLFGP